MIDRRHNLPLDSAVTPSTAITDDITTFPLLIVPSLNNQRAHKVAHRTLQTNAKNLACRLDSVSGSDPQ
jgi:hypothetical protein